ncbi:MAG TPA: metal-binding protein [Blastocatellia bacterium]|nr:metal-binding protein [Blastocatellia bacterium]
MPSGRTHDLVTILLAAPTAAAAYYVTADGTLTGIVTAATVFGGLMFGPDLDTQSYQYTRWGPFRFLWWPYKVMMPHRSSWSHGLLFSTPIRVVYFLIVATLVLAASLYTRDAYLNGAPGNSLQLRSAFGRVWEIFVSANRSHLIAAFVGLWLGAASHTVTDFLGSLLKSARKFI